MIFVACWLSGTLALLCRECAAWLAGTPISKPWSGVLAAFIWPLLVLAILILSILAAIAWPFAKAEAKNAPGED